jgi:RNA polymerase sigma factor (sigma-70 family)
MSHAARVMRGLIIDYIRNRQTEKRGELFVITSLSNKTPENPTAERELTLISQALDELAKVEPGLAEIVDLKFFCGFSFAEIAATQHLSERTVQRKWEKAHLPPPRASNGVGKGRSQ